MGAVFNMSGGTASQGQLKLSPFYLANYTTYKPYFDGRTLTGFEATRCYIAPENTTGYAVNWSGKWEIGCAFMQKDTTGNFCLFGRMDSSDYASVPSAELIGTRLWRGISTSGGTTWTDGYNFDATISANKWFFVRISYDPDTMILRSELTDDFITFATHDYQMSSPPIAQERIAFILAGL